MPAVEKERERVGEGSTAWGREGGPGSRLREEQTKRE